MNDCPFADHYTKCSHYLKDCDAINCWTKVTWEEERVIRLARGETVAPLSLLKRSRAR